MRVDPGHQLGERGTIERKLSLAALRALEVECSEAACEVDRPVCTLGGQPGPTVFWLTWDADLMKLAGVAVYTGS